MAGSLFDQLKSSGLVDDKKAKKIQREKQQQRKQNKPKKGQTVQSEAAKLAQQAAQEKAKRDQELNQKRQQEQAEKAKQAELRQIIESNQVKDFAGDISYNFADDNAVKTLHVNSKTQRNLMNESLRIARFNNGYVLLPVEAADKVELRDKSILIALAEEDSTMSEEDKAYYAKFEIPDDLVW